ncbi:MAG: hypothetical protein H7X85_00495 [Thermoanaerobaculia bacterium]|nr:hypothetical protein [Thermoanaerobaculia bacterium]
MKTVAATLLLAAALPLAAADRSFEKTIPIPRNRDADLDWTHEGCSVESLILRNLPDEDEIEEAREKDPKDKSWLWWEFNVSNRSDEKCRIRLALEVLDSKGAVIKSSDRSDTVKPGELDDDIRVSTLMKTLDVAEAAKVRIRAEVGLKK